jgi:3-phosphoshikimate 1-carboxyvinyltransferase
MTSLKIISVPDFLKGSIQLPASKSISNRVLIIRFLTGWRGGIHNLSDATDTKLLDGILSSPESPVFTDNAGTVMRFLTAVLSIKEGSCLLSGSERMLERPIAPLVEALQSIGADIEYAGKKGFAPILINGKKLRGGEINIPANVSSQFISALLMTAPLMEQGLRINMITKPVSIDYIRMTIALMKDFGIDVLVEADSFIVKPQEYKEKEITIESDWSSAAYIYAMAALKPGSEIRLPGLTDISIQGDCIIREIMNNFGIQTKVESDGIRILSNGTQPVKYDFDFTNYPDLVPVMTALCAVKKITFHFTGVGHLRYKESDRLAALKNELSKTGAIVNIGKNEMSSVKYNQKQSAKVNLDSHNDHRLAMSLALFSFADQGIQISGIECVDKSYPGFLGDMEQLGIELNV